MSEYATTTYLTFRKVYLSAYDSIWACYQWRTTQWRCTPGPFRRTIFGKGLLINSPSRVGTPDGRANRPSGECYLIRNLEVWVRNLHANLALCCLWHVIINHSYDLSSLIPPYKFLLQFCIIVYGEWMPTWWQCQRWWVRGLLDWVRSQCPKGILWGCIFQTDNWTPKTLPPIPSAWWLAFHT